MDGAGEPESGLVVLLPGPAVVRAGFGLTLAYLGWAGERIPAPAPRSPLEVVVVGEPYEAVARLATDPAFLEGALGRVVVGPLLDTGRYRTPPPDPAPSPPQEGDVPGEAAVLTSLGCLKHCGYCVQGVVHARLYPGGAPRRPRPWPGILEDFEVLSGAGVARFRLVADQFLSPEPKENHDLVELARRWNRVPRTVGLSFTGAPRELLANHGLLEALSSVFSLYPRLSVDSLSDETLRLLDLDFDSASALQAARLLGSLGVAYRLNYIFVRPGMTVDGLRKELLAIRELAEGTEHFTPHARLLLTHDVFSRRLGVLPGSPVAARGVPADYEREFPAKVIRAVSAIAEAVAALVDEAGAHADSGHGRPHPLAVAVDAGLEALSPRRHPPAGGASSTEVT